MKNLKNPLSRLLLGLALVLQSVGFRSGVHAAVDAGGSISGTVTNAATGRRLERARVTIEESGRETFTDEDGRFVFGELPTGTIRLRVFYTGLDAQSKTVTIPGPATVDFELEAAGPLRMDKFVVATAKETDGAAIAINEQRFASNLKHVVAADEFGPVVDDNVGEILKFLPGVQATYGEGAVRYISINGVPDGTVPVTMDGFDISSAQGTSRQVDLIFASTANLSRVEVVHSPTPESPGGALAGSVNLVQRSAFEYARPVFEVSAYALMRAHDMEWKRTPGPGDESTRKIKPGFDFSYTNPVNSRFGFSLAGSSATTYLPSLQVQPGWRAARLATNGAAFPVTTSAEPYLTDYALRDFQAVTTRSSIGGTVDFKLPNNQRLSLSLKYVSYDADSRTRTTTYFVNRVAPGDFSGSFTRGAPAAGEVRKANTAFTRDSSSWMPTLKYRHDGAVWKLEGGIGYSTSKTFVDEPSRGYFTTATARRTGVTVSFDDISYQGPRVIHVTDAAGNAVDPADLDNFALTATTGRSNPGTGGDRIRDEKNTAYANAQRHFHWRVPFALKGGLDFRRSERDMNGGSSSFTFVGADGVATTTPTAARFDDDASVAPERTPTNRGARMGFPAMEFMSSERLWELYQSNPNYFRVDQAAQYRSAVNDSKFAEELISSAYIRGDLWLLDSRLKLVGGVRAEQTNVDGLGPKSDATLNFRRDANGNFLRGPNGQPLTIETDPLAVAQLTSIRRGKVAEKEYLRFFPSINAGYNLRENLIARAAYYTSVGRPDFNQYAALLTLPNIEELPAANNRITVANAGIKAWSAQTVKFSLEHYFQGVGQISVGVFRREFDNFFGAVVAPVTPAFLSLYGLDPTLYGDFDVSTQFNIPETVRMQGVELNYKQSLTFLPQWARGVQVFANVSSMRVQGPASAEFAGFIPRTANLGLSMTRQRYSVKVNFNYRSAARQDLVTFAGQGNVDPSTYNWAIEQLKVDLTATLKIRKGLSAFLNVRDFTSAPEGLQAYSETTPDYARLNTYKRYDALWTIGLKSTF